MASMSIAALLRLPWDREIAVIILSCTLEHPEQRYLRLPRHIKVYVKKLDLLS